MQCLQCFSNLCEVMRCSIYAMLAVLCLCDLCGVYAIYAMLRNCNYAGMRCLCYALQSLCGVMRLCDAKYAMLCCHAGYTVPCKLYNVKQLCGAMQYLCNTLPCGAMHCGLSILCKFYYAMQFMRVCYAISFCKFLRCNAVMRCGAFAGHAIFAVPIMRCLMMLCGQTIFCNALCWCEVMQCFCNLYAMLWEFKYLRTYACAEFKLPCVIPAWLRIKLLKKVLKAASPGRRKLPVPNRLTGEGWASG